MADINPGDKAQPSGGSSARGAKGAPRSNYDPMVAIMGGLDTDEAGKGGSAADAGDGAGEGKKTATRGKSADASQGAGSGDDDQGGDGAGDGSDGGEGGAGSGDDDQGGDGAGDGSEDGAGEGTGSGDDDQGGDGAGDGNEGGEGGAGTGEDAAAAAALAAETKRLVAAQLKNFSPEQRKAVETVIAQRTGKILATHSAETKRLEAQVAEMTVELETAQRAKGPAQVANVHPALLVDTAAELDQLEDGLTEQLDQLELYRDEGYNTPDSDGYDPQKPSYTAEQIRQRVRELRREQERILPQARKNLEARATADAALRKVLPAIFDAKSAEYRAAHLILRDQPWLKRLPNFREIVAAQVLGQKVLAELKSKSAAAARSGGGKTTVGKTAGEPRKAPRLPGSGGGAPAKGSGDGRKSGGSGVPEAFKNFGKNPTAGNRDMQKAIEGML